MDTTNILKKTDSNTKVVNIEKKTPDSNKYTTTQEFNKLKKESFA